MLFMLLVILVTKSNVNLSNGESDVLNSCSDADIAFDSFSFKTYPVQI